MGKGKALAAAQGNSISCYSLGDFSKLTDYGTDHLMQDRPSDGGVESSIRVFSNLVSERVWHVLLISSDRVFSAGGRGPRRSTGQPSPQRRAILSADMRNGRWYRDHGALRKGFERLGGVVWREVLARLRRNSEGLG